MVTSSPRSLTTVVITRDRADDLARTLPRHETPVILIDNGSSDGRVARIAERLPHVAYLRLYENCGAVARNLGVTMARTPYVAFADDDSWWERGSLAAAEALLDRHPDIAVVAGRILVGEQRELDPVSELMARSINGTGPPGPEVLGFSACGAVVRREAFLDVGGFDPVVFFAGEEERVATDLTTAGWRICYVPTVVARHQPSVRREPRGKRQALVVRNTVLTALMRRPWNVVMRRAMRSCTTPAGALGVLRAVGRAPRAIRRRVVVPVAVERRLRKVEDTTQLAA